MYLPKNMNNGMPKLWAKAKWKTDTKESAAFDSIIF